MRVTQSMLSQNSLRHLNQSFEKMGNLQDQLSTGKKITRASQDPVVAMSGIRYRTEAGQVEQFQRNSGEVYNWMDSTDSALGKTTDAMQRIRELTTQAANDTYEEGQRENIAEEVAELKDHIADMANTKMNGKYIFNGTDTTNAPIDDKTNIDASDNEGEVAIELLDGVNIPVNSNPTETFSQDLFDDLEGLEEDLRDPDTTGEELSAEIETIDGHIDSIVNERAEVGARLNRVEMIESRLNQQEVTAERIMSDNEDADMEKVITELMSQENVHQAALSSGARIIQPTLMDFLR
ncbi:flagellar hook-associated protein 3 FlgL [Salibacterium salarium]|uniref:flagellar hook-associated protein FlgL n=1 Tax=Salibacterium salarium TaxID=284579 RepID=UPI00277E66BC|nr:flagellar hook-associated protein FlgL [Salibacterium salarium]MDQ0298215.1 flagellar hook-associated protein 3 FlgL [Salibacterium salarium]